MSRLRVAFAALLGAAVVASVASADWDAHAQATRPGRAAPTPAAQTRPAPPASSPAIDAGMLAATQTVAPPGGNGGLDAGVVSSQTLDGGSQVFKFGELDIEGRLKSPQLIYFLRRVRAEFAAGDLGHRTFMRELSETRKRPSF